MAELNLPFGVRVSNDRPVDADRYLADDETQMFALVTNGRAKKGQQCYRNDNDTLYILKGATNSDWEELALGDNIVRRNGTPEQNQLVAWDSANFIKALPNTIVDEFGIQIENAIPNAGFYVADEDYYNETFALVGRLSCSVPYGRFLVKESLNIPRIEFNTSNGSGIGDGGVIRLIWESARGESGVRDVEMPWENGTIALKEKPYTVATLPTGALGDRAYVTDATAPTYLGTLTGGGAVVCPVWHNGAAWVAN